MLDTLRRFLTDLSAAPGPAATDEDAVHVAVAALLTHLVMADGIVEDEERAILERTLATHFDLDPGAARALVEEGREREEEAVDFYAFTGLLKRSLDAAGRRGVVRMMWEVVYADGAAGELEDNIVWRVAELLAVPGRERIEIKHEVQAQARRDRALRSS
jgi:uncharacterized tellurite resistance protein B-like protein